MEMEITLPTDVPVMTLPNTAFFPQALMPLHIFEPRYRQMLRDVLSSDRLFAVAGMNQEELTDAFEPPHRIACVGIIRACQKNDDGTSNLLLQGLCRIEIAQILREEPYRRIRIRALTSQPGASGDENNTLRRELSRLFGIKARLAGQPKQEIAGFLDSVDDPESFVDIAAFSLCQDLKLKQKLLETLNVHQRLAMLRSQLWHEIERLKLQRRLQGMLGDDEIDKN